MRWCEVQCSRYAVQLKDGDVKAHEVLQCVFGDWSCACETNPTAVKTQSFSYVLENQGIRNVKPHGTEESL